MEKTPEEALDVCIDVLREAAFNAPRIHVRDAQIKEGVVTKWKKSFQKKFDDNFDSPKGHWAAVRDKVLQMAHYMGTLTTFHAEAHKKDALDLADFEWARERVKEECGLRAAAANEGHLESAFEVWCS
jgi:hypothetical protein